MAKDGEVAEVLAEVDGGRQKDRGASHRWYLVAGGFGAHGAEASRCGESGECATGATFRRQNPTRNNVALVTGGSV